MAEAARIALAFPKIPSGISAHVVHVAAVLPETRAVFLLARKPELQLGIGSYFRVLDASKLLTRLRAYAPN